MHKSGTPWPLETRVKLVAIYQELCRQNSHYSARQFSRYSDVPYSTFCRWLARWRERGRLALLDAPRRPRRCPAALSGREVTLIRRAHQALGFGVHRLHAALKRDEVHNGIRPHQVLGYLIPKAFYQQTQTL